MAHTKLEKMDSDPDSDFECVPHSVLFANSKCDGEQHCENKEGQTTVCEKARKVLDSVDPKLQRFFHEPPGKGRSVMYGGVNLINGKMYVGQHRHGQGGKSVSQTRWKQHMKANGACPAFSAAVQKYGVDSFKCVILAIVSDEESDEAEIHAISVDGWNTSVHSGGGYNIDKGGRGSEKTEKGIDAIRTAARNPIKRQKHSKDAVALWSDPKFRAKQKAGRIAAHARPHIKKKRSESSKLMWKNPKYREKKLNTTLKLASSPETFVWRSAAAKKRWQDPLYRVKRLESLRNSANFPNFLAKVSSNSKKMWTNPDYRLKKTAELKVIANDPEIKKKKMLTIMKRRCDVLNACATPEERKRKEKQFRSTDQTAKRRAMEAGSSTGSGSSGVSITSHK